MRRAITALVSTAAALVLLFAYRPEVRQLAAPGPAPSTSPTGGGAAPTPTPSAAPTDGGTPATPTPAPQAASGTFTGADVMTPYGDVRVKVVVSAGRLSDVQAVALPSDRSRSQMISQYAGPQLRSEALSAKSAKIDIVSGATYTSEAYMQSLGDALRQAHLG